MCVGLAGARDAVCAIACVDVVCPGVVWMCGLGLGIWVFEVAVFLFSVFDFCA